jgi:hypothetical protein
MLLCAGNVVALRKVLDNLLTDPATIQEASLGVREAPFEIGDIAIVARLPAQIVRVLEVQFMIGAT